MDRNTNQKNKLLELLADGSVWRARDLKREGISSTILTALSRSGEIESTSRGVYKSASLPPADRQSFAEISARAPNGVICLFSAAEFHGLCTKNPRRVHVAFGTGRRPPKMDHPPLRAVYWRNTACFSLGIEEIDIAGVKVRITDEARTVVDLYRYRERSGNAEHAMEALNTFVDRGGDTDLLLSYAREIGSHAVISEHLLMKLHMGVTP